MTTELDRIKAKIIALAGKTVANGCSEQEAMAAMQGVGRLLLQYNLTMEECDVRRAKCKTIFIDIGRTRRHPIDQCATDLAKLVDCKVWFHRSWTAEKGRGSAHAFFGQEQDLDLVQYLFHVIHNAMEAEAKLFKQRLEYLDIGTAGARRGAYISFQHGMAFRLAARLREIKQQNDAARAAQATSTALVLLKGQLVEDEFRQHGPKLRTYTYTRQITNAQAYYAGKKAGDNVNLNRPLGTDAVAAKARLT